MAREQVRRMQQAKEKSHEGVGNLLDLGGIDMEEAKIGKQGQLDTFRGSRQKLKLRSFIYLNITLNKLNIT